MRKVFMVIDSDNPENSDLLKKSNDELYNLIKYYWYVDEDVNNIFENLLLLNNEVKLSGEIELIEVFLCR